ncbi:MAG: cell division protein FtsZ [Treponema sp.]|nr:cell division protein FtsZ [Treponema sp.]
MQIFEVREFEPSVAVLPAMSPAVIKVVGAGGGGSNAVNRMIESGLSGVQFIVINTDVQDLSKSMADYKLQIGSRLTGGRGAGGKPSTGEDAAKEDLEKISDLLRGADMVFVTAGMGGGTGTGSAPVIAKIAKDHGALTVGVVTKPFTFEGKTKMLIAEDGIHKLREEVDTLIVIPNENLFKIVDSKMTSLQAYGIADDVLNQGVQAIADLITKPGIINTDFADVQSTMKGQGDALMGIGKGSGDTRARDAAAGAIDNPLLEDTSIKGATRLLVNISGPENITMVEIAEIMQMIKAEADPDVETIYGQNYDPDLGDNIKVTVIATGFHERKSMPVHKDNPQRRYETALGEIVSHERFKEMMSQGSGHRNFDSFSGYSKSGVNSEIFDVPSVVRRFNPETDDGLVGNLPARRRNA